MLLELLENPNAELSSEFIARLTRSIVETRVPEELEDVIRESLQLRESLVDLVVEERLGLMLRGVCPPGVDARICTFLSRLREAYRALLSGLLIVDDAGRAYVRFKVQREYDGMLVPRGAIMSMHAGEALVLYAMGDVELASIKPLKANP